MMDILMSTIEDLASTFERQLTVWPAGRLPPVRELSKLHGTSTKTVQSALELLRTRGLVESRPRSGFWRTGQQPRHTEIASTRSTAQDLADRLTVEIQEGRHPWNASLPSIKELSAQWNCHAQTTSKALERCIEAGVVERRGRLHFPKRPRLTTRRIAAPNILCIGTASEEGFFRMDKDRESDFWRELGAQAAFAGLSLVRQPWRIGDRIRPNESTVGVVASTWNNGDPMLLCRELARLRIPACLWVEEHTMEGLALDSRIKFHDQGYSSEIGRLVARHLIEQGHTHLAYVAPWHLSLWSRNRLKGIEEEAALYNVKVDAFCLDGDSEWDTLVPARSDPTLFSEFPTALVSRLVEGPGESVRAFAAESLATHRIARLCAPLFEQALASDATAWIATNDVCALHGMRWLRSREIDIPGSIAIAGFDDTIESLRADLTSFRFSCDSIARSMIHQILTAEPSPVLTRHHGMVVPRGSTSRILARITP
jgi:DNA-binding transcriptional regulator YhcF (GntR family)